MKSSASIDSLITGAHLAFVHEQAGLNRDQPENRLSECDAQDWDEIKCPDFDHPDRDVLWKANLALGKLRQLRSNPNLINTFTPRVDLYDKELRRLAAFLLSRKHRIAFVGSIGVGKSTAICKLFGLVKPGESRLTKETVLETGGGRTTLCKVRIVGPQGGSRYGLQIIPRTDESIRKDVEDYAEYLIQRTQGDGGSGQCESEEHDSLGISKEVIRAIQNMAGLTAKPERTKENGKVASDDPAVELAIQHPRIDELTDAILARMNLAERIQDIEWYPEDDKTTPMQWLQSTFKAVNNGKHPRFTLPETIDVILPQPLLAAGHFPITVIDTKGIDQTAERQDLESLFDDPSTLVVLCSTFMDAPGVPIQTLLLRVREIGVRDIAQKAMILVLARSDEAMAVKDDLGCEAECDEEGYQLKRDHINPTLQRLGLADLPVLFYNAKNEAAEPVHEALVASIASYRQLYGKSIEQLSEDVERLISDLENAQVQMVFREVERRLTTWIETNREIDWDDTRVQDSLLAAIKTTRYASTIRAAVNRSGDGENLDYYHHLGHHARRLAFERIGEKIERFEIIATNAIDDEDLAPARTFLGRVVECIKGAADTAYKQIQIVAWNAFRKELQQDRPFWHRCQRRWGRGIGYREEIREMTADQLDGDCRDAHRAVRLSVAQEWATILNQLEELLKEREARENTTGSGSSG